MADPVTIDIPHKLGLAGARAKIDQGLGQIIGVIPGSSLRSQRWEGNTLHFQIEALGQTVAAQVEVFESKVHAIIDLPPLVALFAGKIKGKLAQVGTKLLR